MLLKPSKTLWKYLLLLVITTNLAACGDGGGKAEPDPSEQNTITVEQVGLGFVESNDASISCGETCSSNYSKTGLLELIATPGVNYKFLDWIGCKSTEGNSCIVSIGPEAADVTVTARYNPLTIKLYDLTFDSPVHEIGYAPAFGFQPKLVSEYFGSGTTFEQFSPFIKQGSLSQVLSFQGQLNVPGTYVVGDTMSLALAENAERYRFEWDMQINQISEFTVYKVFFDWTNSSNFLEFFMNGNVVFNGQFVSNVNFSELFHVIVEIDLNQRNANITIGNQLVSDIPLDVKTTDIRSIRYYLVGINTTDNFLIDNLLITAKLNNQLSTSPPSIDGEYLIDFDFPQITNDSGQSATGVSPFTQDNFNITDILRRDPSRNPPGIPTNGTIHFGITFNARPILYHKYGFSFSLQALDVADYSTSSKPLTPITIEGYKRNGEVLTYTINPSDININFKTINFGPEWQDLDYVIFNGYGISVDNLSLSISDELTHFEAVNVQ